MAMTDKELNEWIDQQVNAEVEAQMKVIRDYINSGKLDEDVEADFAEEEARVRELEAQGLDEPDDSDKYEFYDEDAEDDEEQ